MKLLVATRNLGKVRELADMLGDLDVSWLSLDDIALTNEVAETGATFEANAILKAEGYAGASKLLTLADDSGLEVDALNGRPGVHTARYGGAGLTSEQRYLRLLEELKDVPDGRRTARFRCVVALARPEGVLGVAEGVCEGSIARTPKGEGGFGYDPVFYLTDQHMTMAELPAEEKHRLSHRGQAFARITPLLRQALAK
jgi:XTP/dITP diphosphohydrolase